MAVIGTTAVGSTEVPSIAFNVCAAQCLGDFALDIGDGLADSLSAVAFRVAVAQFRGFAFAGGCAGGRTAAVAAMPFSRTTVAETGRVSLGVEDFKGVAVGDAVHDLMRGSFRVRDLCRVGGSCYDGAFAAEYAAIQSDSIT
jgi:hypothetical protein